MTAFAIKMIPVFKKLQNRKKPAVIINAAETVTKQLSPYTPTNFYCMPKYFLLLK